MFKERFLLGNIRNLQFSCHFSIESIDKNDALKSMKYLNRSCIEKLTTLHTVDISIRMQQSGFPGFVWNEKRTILRYSNNFDIADNIHSREVVGSLWNTVCTAYKALKQLSWPSFYIVISIIHQRSTGKKKLWENLKNGNLPLPVFFH